MTDRAAYTITSDACIHKHTQKTSQIHVVEEELAVEAEPRPTGLGGNTVK